MKPPEPVGEAVLARVVALGRALRQAGVRAGVDRELTFCRALAEVDVRDRDRVGFAARASFVSDPAELHAFEAVFERFWEGASLSLDDAVAEHGETDPRMPGPQHGGESLPQFRRELMGSRMLGAGSARATREIPSSPGEALGRGERRGVLAAWSPVEVETERERVDLARDEVAAVRRLAAELRAAAPLRRSRRLAPSRRQGRLDLRRTLRRAMSTDGEAVRPAFAAPSRRPRKLLFLCDVSGSMERYSRALLASLQASVAAGIRAEAFVFATRLTRVTGPLACHDVALALERARGKVTDWSGGTRIGQALADFNASYAGLGLARGAFVVVVSDGWDRGDPAVLERELERLRRQCRRLVWLNPRPGELDRQPLAIGMRAALRHVDDFVPGHDPRASGDLARLVRGLGPGRPRRPQRAVGLAAR
jgi:uncharacterized protein with von Willebrand factor type A (vWA) domain